jgi:AmmeMemoRadiSam system protein B
MSQSTIYHDIRPSPIAGQWYPGQRDRLAASVDGYLDSKPPAEVPGTIIGLVAPHAGHIYSGPIAADAFRLVRGKTFRRVVIVSPLHSYMPQALLTSGHEAYATPLGTVPIDRETMEAIGERVKLARVRRDPEHALEIELPFLQRALSGEFSLVPIMVRDQRYAMARQLGEAIAGAVSSEDTLLVASSDLSHFYTDSQARALDKIMLGQIEGFDPEGVIRVEDEGRAFACGRAAIATVLVAARALGADRVTVVGYGTSGDTSGDRTRVVGYGAAAISKT